MMVEWQGKLWFRSGECNRCGECCFAGWAQPCPHIRQQPDYTVLCAIRDKLEAGAPNDEEALATCRVNTTACIPWPADPGDLLNAHPATRNRCEYSFHPVERILVACPTYDGKAYSWPRWIEAVRALDYPAYDVLAVDNSRTPEFYERYRDQIPMLRVEVASENSFDRIMAGMEAIRRHFLAGPWERWFNLEADVIVPPEALRVLLQHGKDCDWIGHAYPHREGTHPAREESSGIGCSLLTRRLVEGYDFVKDGGPQSPDCALWDYAREHRFPTREIWHHMQLEHLGN